MNKRTILIKLVTTYYLNIYFFLTLTLKVKVGISYSYIASLSLRIYTFQGLGRVKIVRIAYARFIYIIRKDDREVSASNSI